MPWSISAASVTGTSHHHDGTPCQDAYAYHQTPEVLLLAVADGAGSAPQSKRGATLAAQAAVSYLAGALHGRRPRPHILQEVLQGAVLHGRDAITQHAREGCTVHDYATTLLIATITKHHIGIAQVGDGAIVTNNNRGQLATLTRQQEREYINEVTFLTSNDYERELYIAVRKRSNLRAIALFTDGVETLCVRRRDNAPHPNFFHPLLMSNPTSDDLVELLASLAVCERTDDDKTIIIATPGADHALR